MPLLPLILLAGLVVITALAYAGPQDPTWIAGLYDAADYDDEIVLLMGTYTHPSLAGEPGRPVAIGPFAVVARVAACSSTAVSQIAILFADRLRAPPERPEPWSVFLLGLLTLRNSRKPVPAAVQALPLFDASPALNGPARVAHLRTQPTSKAEPWVRS